MDMAECVVSRKLTEIMDMKKKNKAFQTVDILSCFILVEGVYSLFSGFTVITPEVQVLGIRWVLICKTSDIFNIGVGVFYIYIKFTIDHTRNHPKMYTFETKENLGRKV